MAWQDRLDNIVKQTKSYLETGSEKVAKMKDKTLDKVKGIDNPAHYQAPAGFTKFTLPVALAVAEIPKTMDKLKPFALKESNKIMDAYIRLCSLLLKRETIIDALIVTAKKTYLFVFTNQDRLLIVHKEHYRIFLRHEISRFQIETTGVSGMTFSVNEYLFTSTEKFKTYQFILNYCREKVKDYNFSPYEPYYRQLNYYEKFKYGILNRQNGAIDENKHLSLLFEPLEYPLISVYGTCQDTSYILALTTMKKMYLAYKDAYTVIPISDIKKFGVVNQGIFYNEFYLDNYYFTNGGPDQKIETMIQLVHQNDFFEQTKNTFLEENKILFQFPFENAISYQASSGSSIVLSDKQDCFLICYGIDQIEFHEKKDFDHYELRLEEKPKEIWTSSISQTTYEIVSKKDALENYGMVTICIFLKNQTEPILEIPLIMLKTNFYKNGTTKNASKETILQFLDQLDHLKG